MSTRLVIALIALVGCEATGGGGAASGNAGAKVAESGTKRGSAGGFSATLAKEMGAPEGSLGAAAPGAEAATAGSAAAAGSGTGTAAATGTGTAAATGTGTAAAGATGTAAAAGTGTAAATGAGTAAAGESGGTGTSAAGAAGTSGAGTSEGTSAAGAGTSGGAETSGAGGAGTSGGAVGATSGTGAVVQTLAGKIAAATPPPGQSTAPPTSGNLGGAVAPAPDRAPVKPSRELAAIKFDLEPNWERDVGEAGTFSLVVKLPNSAEQRVFTVRYGYEDPTAPVDCDQYRKYLDEKKLMKVTLNRQSGAACYIEGTENNGVAAFRFLVNYGGKRLLCRGSLYKDRASSALGDLRDKVLMQAKKICETMAL